MKNTFLMIVRSSYQTANSNCYAYKQSEKEWNTFEGLESFSLFFRLASASLDVDVKTYKTL